MRSARNAVVATTAAVFFFVPVAFGEDSTEGDKAESDRADDGADRGVEDKATNWRDDPSVARHPGSYVGVGSGYSQSRAWVQSNEDHPDFEVGALHSWQTVFRVGDAFTEWFSLGFKNVLMQAAKGKSESIAAFALFLDSTFYPWKGLGISPAVGLGFRYATGKSEFEFDYGGPLSLSLSLMYEFRITRLLVIAPTAQTYWVRSDNFDGLFIFFGLEFIKWFDSATG